MILRRLVVRAMAGEIRATKLIVGLIEGRLGLRVKDSAPDDPARRRRVQATMESLVRFMAERATSALNIGTDDAQADNPR